MSFIRLVGLMFLHFLYEVFGIGDMPKSIILKSRTSGRRSVQLMRIADQNQKRPHYQITVASKTGDKAIECVTAYTRREGEALFARRA